MRSGFVLLLAGLAIFAGGAIYFKLSEARDYDFRIDFAKGSIQTVEFFAKPGTAYEIQISVHASDVEGVDCLLGAPLWPELCHEKPELLIEWSLLTNGGKELALGSSDRSPRIHVTAAGREGRVIGRFRTRQQGRYSLRVETHEMSPILASLQPHLRVEEIYDSEGRILFKYLTGSFASFLVIVGLVLILWRVVRSRRQSPG